MPLKSEHADVFIPNQPLYEIILDAIWKNSRLYPDRPAVIDGEFEDCSITFAEIYIQSYSVASFLRTRHFDHGDVAVIFVANCWHFTVFFLGTALLGGCVSGANATATNIELRHQLVDARCKVVLTDQQNLPKVESALEHCPDIHTIVVIDCIPPFEPLSSTRDLVFSWTQVIDFRPDLCLLSKVQLNLDSDLQLLPYSSGTTGPPKGVMLSHRNITAMMSIFFSHSTEFTMSNFGSDWHWENETQLLFLPYSHIYGFYLMLQTLYCGSTAVVLRNFDGDNFLRPIQKYKIRLISMVPPILVFLAKHPLVSKYDISSIEIIFSGAAAAGKDICQQLMTRHPNVKAIVQGYGMTEMSLASHLPAIESNAKLGNNGKLNANFEAMVVNLENGSECPPNKSGELWVRSPSIMKGYLNNPKATADTVDSQGWLHTGDIGYHDEFGYLFIIDRLKELIKVRGFQVAPAELEDMLLSHPGILDAAVIGITDEKAGELPRAYIVRRDKNLAEQQIAHYISERLSHYKHLKGGVEFVDQIPKSPSGKILRRVLREQAKKSTRKTSKL